MEYFGGLSTLLHCGWAPPPSLAWVVPLQLLGVENMG